MNRLITFADVNIIPKFSTVASRENVILSVNQKGLPYLTLPVVSSNMDTVTGTEMAKAMIRSGGQAALHRFCSIEENVKTFEDSTLPGFDNRAPMVSIGLGAKELERAEALRDAGATTFIIDVNNGANIAVAQQANELRDILGKDYGIIVGNFATGDTIEAFLGHCAPTTVDGFKVGIGGGSICTTRIKTGVGIPQISALLDCRPAIREAGLTMIADGGVRTAGDVCKAMAAGAHMVMLGGMLAGTDEAPGDYVNAQGQPLKFLTDGTVRVEDWITHKNNVKIFKKYRGSASLESYEAQGKLAKYRAVEGESFLIPHKGPVTDILQDIEGGLRGAFSMVGAFSVQEFHRLAEFVMISGSSFLEGTAHANGQKL